ncbi:hypothetical protein TNCV_3930261 [Trichonephila clavipes]|nr:hypothetical protein TNCV_3930261 [Trichonephila clavipes]
MLAKTKTSSPIGNTPSDVKKKQFNSPPQLENQSQYRRKTTQLVSRNETTQLGIMNETTQQEKTTQLSSMNEQLNSATGTKQLHSAVGTKQLNSALLSTAYNRLHRLYSRISFFYLLA